MKHEHKYSEGEWKSTHGIRKKRGVRNKGGFICFLTEPSRYPGQDERYEQELETYKADAKLIAAAPDLLNALIELKRWIVDAHIAADALKNANAAINKALK